MIGGAGKLPPIPSILTLGLPGPNDTPPGPESMGQWYHDVMQMPGTRVSGYFGATLGSPEGDHDVQLFFYEKNHLDPKLRLIINERALLSTFSGIANILQRLGILKEWNLTPIPQDDAQ